MELSMTMTIDVCPSVRLYVFTVTRLVTRMSAIWLGFGEMRRRSNNIRPHISIGYGRIIEPYVARTKSLLITSNHLEYKIFCSI